MSKYSESIAFLLDDTILYPFDPSDPDPDRLPNTFGISDLKINSFGVTFSTGVSYRISPVVSMGIYADGMISSGEKIIHGTTVFGNPYTIEFSRKMNRIGILAGINFNF